MLRHWQYNVIVTQSTGAINCSVSDSVEEKGTTEKKETAINVWSVCEELAIIHEESRGSTNKQQSVWIYQYCIF